MHRRLPIISTVYEVYTRADLEAPGELASVMLTSSIVFFAFSAKKTHTVTGSNSVVSLERAGALVLLADIVGIDVFIDIRLCNVAYQS